VGFHRNFSDKVLTGTFSSKDLMMFQTWFFQLHSTEVIFMNRTIVFPLAYLASMITTSAFAAIPATEVASSAGSLASEMATGAVSAPSVSAASSAVGAVLYAAGGAGTGTGTSTSTSTSTTTVTTAH
jgi:hypothetical protein